MTKFKLARILAMAIALMLILPLFPTMIVSADNSIINDPNDPSITDPQNDPVDDDDDDDDDMNDPKDEDPKNDGDDDFKDDDFKNDDSKDDDDDPKDNEPKDDDFKNDEPKNELINYSMIQIMRDDCDICSECGEFDCICDPYLVSNEADLQAAIDSASTDPDNVTVITLTNEIYLTKILNIPTNKKIILTSDGDGPYKIDAGGETGIGNFVILVNANAELTLKNIIITGGYKTGGSPKNGGGIFVSASTLILEEGAKITENTAYGTDGGGVYVNQGTLIMYDGSEISNNTSTSKSSTGGNGGGVKVDGNGGTVIMYGGTISENSASYGSGIQINNNGELEMYGGTIENNKNGAYGGVDMDYDSSKAGKYPVFTMSGGTISGNGTGVNNRRTGGIFTIDGNTCVINDAITIANSNGIMKIENGVQFKNYGILTNNGTLNNYGELINYGTIDNRSTNKFNNTGVIINQKGAEIIGNSVFSSYNLQNKGTIYDNGGKHPLKDAKNEIKNIGDPLGKIIPLKPTSFKASDIKETSITLTWAAGESFDIAGYEIEYSSDGGKTWISAEENPIEKTEFSLTFDNLNPDTAYDFRIRIINSYTDTSSGSVSDPAEITAKTLPMPKPPVTPPATPPPPPVTGSDEGTGSSSGSGTEDEKNETTNETDKDTNTNEMTKTDETNETDKTDKNETDENDGNDETTGTDTIEPTEDGFAEEDDDDKLTKDDDETTQKDGDKNDTAENHETGSEATDESSESSESSEPSENTEKSQTTPPAYTGSTSDDDEIEDKTTGTDQNKKEYENLPALISLFETENFEEMMTNAIPLSNGWFAVALEDDWWMIFDESGIPLGIILLSDVTAIENHDIEHIENNLIRIEEVISQDDLDTFNKILNIEDILNIIKQPETDPVKENPKTGDNLVLYVILSILTLTVVSLVLFKKKIRI